LKDLHAFIRAELTKDQTKDLGHLSKFGMEAQISQDASIERSQESESLIDLQSKSKITFLGKQVGSEPNLK